MCAMLMEMDHVVDWLAELGGNEIPVVTFFESCDIM